MCVFVLGMCVHSGAAVFCVTVCSAHRKQGAVCAGDLEARAVPYSSRFFFAFCLNFACKWKSTSLAQSQSFTNFRLIGFLHYKIKAVNLVS